jgi:hypothetical protein
MDTEHESREYPMDSAGLWQGTVVVLVCTKMDLTGWAFLDEPLQIPIRANHGTLIEHDGIFVQPCGWYAVSAQAKMGIFYGLVRPWICYTTSRLLFGA